MHALGVGSIPTQSLAITGISPSALFILITICPNFAGMSSTGSAYSQLGMISALEDLRVDRLPALNARPMG